MTDVLAGGSHPAHSTVNGSPFPPIADYGFLSDCEVCALIAPSGNVEWMCLPRMDGPSVFAAILDRERRVVPARARPTSRVPAGRRYLPGTMVLETTWATPDGLGRGPRRAADRAVAAPGAPIGASHRRAPADHDADRVLLRTVRCLNGSIDFVLECEPAFDYGRQRGAWRHAGRRLRRGRGAASATSRRSG